MQRVYEEAYGVVVERIVVVGVLEHGCHVDPGGHNEAHEEPKGNRLYVEDERSRSVGVAAYEQRQDDLQGCERHREQAELLFRHAGLD